METQSGYKVTQDKAALRRLLRDVHFPEAGLRFDEPMKLHTTFRIGGPADVFFAPRNRAEIEAMAQFCRAYDVPLYVMGNGSNILMGDGGWRGVVMQIGGALSTVEAKGADCIRAEAGITLKALADYALSLSLAGLEFASGIPGALGGALYMNAGAYGGEMKDVVFSVEVIDRDGSILTLDQDQLDFGYRTSRIQTAHLIALAATLRLVKGEAAEIRQKMDELNKRRAEKQPLETPSAGSTFKRPEGYFAGKLIMDSGLRGYTIGGAQVSEKHCGFVVNTGGATAKDVCALITHVQAVVEEKFGVRLEPEVRLIGEE